MKTLSLYLKKKPTKTIKFRSFVFACICVKENLFLTFFWVERRTTHESKSVSPYFNTLVCINHEGEFYRELNI